MPVFSKTLKNLDGLPPEEGIKAVAGHLRSMQEELEYRLTCLDSSNITEIDTTQTNILTSNGEFAGIVSQMSSIGIELDMIRSIVNGQSAEFDKKISVVEQTANAITTRVEANEGDIKSLSSRFEQTAGSITAAVEDLQNGAKASLKLNANGLTYTDEKGTVMINGQSIEAGTVIAGNLVGKKVTLADRMEYGYLKTAGEIALAEAQSGAYAVDFSSLAAMRVGAKDGRLFLYSGYDDYNYENHYPGACLTLQYFPEIPDTAVICKGTFIPNANGAWYCGNSNYKWQAVYAVTGTIQTSDRNSKNSIESLPEKYVDMFDAVTPVRFKMNDGTSGRYHVGFIAQDVEAGMALSGVDSLEFGGWCKDTAEDGSDIYMLRYEEFIGVLAAKIKQLESRINEMEAKA